MLWKAGSLRSILRIASYVVLAEAERLTSEERTDEFVLARACMYAMDSMHAVVATDGLIGVAVSNAAEIIVHRAGGQDFLLYLWIVSHRWLRC